MKNYKKMLLISVLMQPFACIAMDEQKQIEAFVQKQQSRNQESPITFFWPIDDEIKDFFPQNRLPLSKASFEAIQNKFSSKINIAVQQQKAPIVKLLGNEPMQQNNDRALKVDHTQQMPKVDGKKKRNTIAQQPVKKSTLRTVQPICCSNGILIQDRGTQEREFDIDQLITNGKNLYQKFLENKAKNRINGPYWHRSSSLVFIPINHKSSYVYNPVNDSVAVLDAPFTFPNDNDIETVWAIFHSNNR